MKTYIIVCISLILIFLACGKSTEVFVVDDDTNILPSNTPTANQEKPTSLEIDDFNKITIGELGSILTLDPLFATSSSELRVISLIFDGLTTIGNAGNIEPAIAKSWTTTRDSLTYTFTLNSNAVYHSTNSISGWSSRAVSTTDIINVFKRMGNLNVPHYAASLFESIDGFKPYVIEQTEIKNPAARVINSIKGISSPNDSTIVFRLNRPDSQFLQNLAHPWASIYPAEILPSNNTPIQIPIGTGVFYLDQKQENTLILAASDKTYKNENIPDRVDVIYGKNEGDLYQDFAKGTLDAIIELSPSIYKQVSDSTGALDFVFSKAFNLELQQAFRSITLNYNPNSTNENVFQLLASNNSLTSFDDNLGVIIYGNEQSFNAGLDKQTVVISYTEDPTELYLINTIADLLSSKNSTVVLNSSYAIGEHVSFSVQNFMHAKPVLTWKYPVYILSKKSVSGINITHTNWNISFDGVTKNDE